jgi:hypothetical protein
MALEKPQARAGSAGYVQAGFGNTIGTVRVTCSNGPKVELPLTPAQRVSMRKLRPKANAHLPLPSPPPRVCECRQHWPQLCRMSSWPMERHRIHVV